MSINGIVTRGFGSWCSVNDTVTRGFCIGGLSPDGALKMVAYTRKPAKVAHGSRAINITNAPTTPRIVKK